ncbi:MAG: isopenicillin N synthase family oxygenase [Proteobacteria bacterium]|nr:isopenicillin N synthase family oxygenase [Pseudomonadota bacterium]
MSVQAAEYMTLVQPIRMGEAPPAIPVIDVAPFLNGEPGALDAAASTLRHALEEVGFYVIVGHGVPQETIDEAYSQIRRFFAMPAEKKTVLAKNEHNIGYTPLGARYNRATSDLNDRAKKEAAAESYFMKTDLAPDHPDVLAGKRFRSPNLWPAEADAPGFRAAMVTYMRALEKLGKSLLPLYARALDLPLDYFDKAFVEPMYTLRISRYPRQATLEGNKQGLPPHTDTSFMTLLPYNRVQGLQVRLTDGTWADAPAIPGSFVINSGNMLRRWSNDRCMSTPHQVVNLSPEERYALPFFLDCNRDWLMDCMPSCTSSSKPPRYKPMTYVDYMAWYSTVDRPGEA